MASISVPEGSTFRVLLAESDKSKISLMDPLSLEKMSTLLTLYKADDWLDALDIAKKCIHMAGHGHTSSYHTALQAQDRIDKYTSEMQACHIMINQPSSVGVVGGVFNFMRPVAFSVGCGSYGGNSTSDSIQCKHLLNYKQICIRRETAMTFRMPKILIGA